MPLSGKRARRGRQGVLKIDPGAVRRVSTEGGNAQTHPYLLQRLRAPGRGGHRSGGEERGAPHPAEARSELAKERKSASRFLPLAPPALPALAHLGSKVKGRARSERATPSSDSSATTAGQPMLPLRPWDRLNKAGVCSGDFWLTS